MADQLFTTARVTEPDQLALLAALRATVDAAATVWWQNETRYRVSKPTAWTAPQIAAAQLAIDTAPVVSIDLTAGYTSRQKDVLTTCALIVRARGIPAWNALTLPQKITATFAEADVWRDMRIWAETNL